MLRRLIELTMIVLAAAAAGWALWPQPVPVDTARIAKRDITVVVEEEGKSRIRDVYTVSAPSSGQMLRVNLHAGDQVVRDMTIVASIKPADPALLDARTRRVLEAAADAAGAAVDLAAAELRQANAQLTFLQGELDRATALVRRGTISTRAFEKAGLDVETGKAAVESAKALLMVRKRELERARAELGGGAGGGTCCVEVRAPVSGRVLRVLTESEQVVQAGTPLIEIGDPADLEITADLLSSDAVLIKPGAGAVIEGWGGSPLPAAVTRIDPSAVTKVSALGIEEQRVTVVLKFNGPAESYRTLGHGFRVVVKITVWSGQGLTAVPLGALFRQGAEWAVYVAEGGRAKLRLVALGARNDEFAEVKSGLNDGEAVILHPSDTVQDGIRIVASETN
jgi:HlyD family secretion protein